MKRSIVSFSFLLLVLLGWSGCSSKTSDKDAKTAARAADKIQGKALVMTESITDSAMNAGGPSVYLVEGLHRYRMFFNKAADVAGGKEYMAEGVYAQKAIDEIGDPDQGKNGYPLAASCEHVVHMAWSGLALDIAAGDAEVLCATIKRHPARAIFLVTKLDPAPPKTGAAAAEAKKDEEGEEKEIPEISVPWDKQKASLIQGPTSQAAPLWEPAGETVRCKVLIDTEGKVSELQTGMQLCESVPWDQFHFQPAVQRGKPVKVKTEVEIHFEPRK